MQEIQGHVPGFVASRHIQEWRGQTRLERGFNCMVLKPFRIVGRVMPLFSTTNVTDPFGLPPCSQLECLERIRVRTMKLMEKQSLSQHRFIQTVFKICFPKNKTLKIPRNLFGKCPISLTSDTNKADNKAISNLRYHSRLGFEWPINRSQNKNQQLQNVIQQRPCYRYPCFHKITSLSSYLCKNVIRSLILVEEVASDACQK